MKNGFFSTNEGRLGAAMILVLLSLPVIVLSLGAGSEAGGVIGVVMICLGMAYPPVKSFTVKPETVKKTCSKDG